MNESLERDAFGDYKVATRLTDEHVRDLVGWARREVVRHPALQGHLFRPDGRPKISSIVRRAALTTARRETK